ncbi:hypothetical protein BH23PLA1_BH23PLA1_11460 [soil metagenome]
MRFLNAFLKYWWGFTDFIRRPLRRKFDSVMSRPLRLHIIPRMEGLEHGVIQSNQKVDLLTHDVNLALNGAIREIVRLQMQIEVLQQIIEESRSDDRQPFDVVTKAG